MNQDRDYDVMCMLDLDDAYEIGAERSAHGFPTDESSPFSMEFDPVLVFEADRGWVDAYEVERAYHEQT